MPKVRLTRKHADCIDGVDLSAYRVGDLVELPAAQARLLVAEKWGILERRVRSVATTLHRRADDARRFIGRKLR